MTIEKLELFRQQWLQPFADLLVTGKLVSPRGLKILELEDYQFELDPENRFCAFDERKLSLKYLVGELCWYLAADPEDFVRIEYYSKFWKKLRNAEPPYYNSNYGYAFFREKQFNHVVETLKNDKDSRQASVIINKAEVMMSDSKDKICTNSVNFRIREDKLNMSVSMRSNDYVLGTPIDVFQFLSIYDLVFWHLKASYPDLEKGKYVHKVDSFHIYSDKFELLGELVANNTLRSTSTFSPPEMPDISSLEEAKYVMDYLPFQEEKIRQGQSTMTFPANFKFVTWALQQLQS